MMNFIKIIINRNTREFKNIVYLPEVFNLYKKFGRYLYDDYFVANTKSLLDGVLDLVEKLSPYFWIVFDKKNEKVAGFAFLSNIVGAKGEYHSAEVTTCFKPEYWGDYTKKCAKKFIKYCFKKFKFKKIKAVIFQENSKVKAILRLSGFKKEALLKGETLKNGKLQNVEIYSILRKKEVKDEH